MEWFGLESAFKGHLGSEQGPPQGDQFASNAIQTVLEYFQACGISTSLENLL